MCGTAERHMCRSESTSLAPESLACCADMAEIGATLREARMRARIDVSEIEAQTKIRAKYLRALENEEWDLLPGPTFVRSFLRTYAQALGLDAKALVDEYRMNYEQPSELDHQPVMSPPRRATHAPELEQAGTLARLCDRGGRVRRADHPADRGADLRQKGGGSPPTPDQLHKRPAKPQLQPPRPQLPPLPAHRRGQHQRARDALAASHRRRCMCA